jgi:hypothetical protein
MRRPGVRPSSAPPNNLTTDGGTAPAVFVLVANPSPSRTERVSKPADCLLHRRVRRVRGTHRHPNIHASQHVSQRERLKRTRPSIFRRLAGLSVDDSLTSCLSVRIILSHGEFGSSLAAESGIIRRNGRLYWRRIVRLLCVRCRAAGDNLRANEVACRRSRN